MNAAIAHTLNQGLHTDADLASVREESIDALPTAEHESRRTLWADRVALKETAEVNSE